MTTTHPHEPGRRSLARFLPPVTLLAVLTITASSEYELARTVLQLPAQIAWALPVAFDSYVLAALRSRRDVAAALTVMAGALTCAMGAHLLDAQTDQLPAVVVAPTATAIMTILVIVAWRVHVLIEQPAPTPTASAAAGTPPIKQASEYTRPEYTPSEYGSVPEYTTREYTRPEYDRPVQVRALPRPTTSHQPHPAVEDPEQDEPAQARAADAAPRMSDEQILAEIGTPPPSIRALMRAYGIGQSRASRLHAHASTRTDQILTAKPAAQHRATTTTTTSDETQQHQQHDYQHQNQHENDQNEHHDDQLRNDDNSTQNSHHDNHARNPQQESPGMTTKESHPCITDRVGQSRSTSGRFAAPVERHSGGVPDPLGTAFLFPEWEAELAAAEAAADALPGAVVAGTEHDQAGVVDLSSGAQGAGRAGGRA